MASDATLRTILIWLAAVIAVVGLSTHSFRKMLVTYLLGVLWISGVLLPDWDYFDRDFTRWTSPPRKGLLATPTDPGSKGLGRIP